MLRVLDDQVPVVLRTQDSALDENTGHDVGHAVYHARYIYEQTGGEHPVRFSEWLQGMIPLNAPGDDHEQAAQRLGQIAIVLLQAWVDLCTCRAKLSHSLG